MSNQTFSQVQLTNKDKKATIDFTCIGSWQHQPLFQLDLNNDEKEIYYITIKDGDENILYSEHIQGTNIKRKYLLEIDQDDLNDPRFKLSFEVSGRKNSGISIFHVSQSIRDVNNILIAKL